MATEYLSKAVSLLHSKSADSTEQLKALVDECLSHRQASQAPQASANPSKIKASLNLAPIPISTSTNSTSASTSSITTSTVTIAGSSVGPSNPISVVSNLPPSIPTTNTPSSSSNTGSSPSLSKPVIVAPPSAPANIDNDDTDTDDQSCAVCHSSDRTPSNELVECQECHSLYHQDCHKPGLADQDISDPRFVWYCSQCTKNQKKVKLMAKTKIVPITPGGLSGSTPNKDQSPNPSSTTVNVGPFRSAMSTGGNLKGKTETNPTSSTKLAGLSSFAANLHKNKNKN